VEARLKQAKHTSEDIMAMYKERSSIEEEYGKRLTKLGKTFCPKDEIG
jgi:IS4 transposase